MPCRESNGLQLHTPSGLQHSEPLSCVFQGNSHPSPAFGIPIHVRIGTAVQPDGWTRRERNNHRLAKRRFVIPAHDVTGDKILIEPVVSGWHTNFLTARGIA